MNIPKKGFFARLFCKHSYKWFIAPSKSKFVALNSEKNIEVCTKCGKTRGACYARID